MEPSSLLDKVISKDEFSTSNWTMRRGIIRKTLVFCAIVFSLILGFIAYLLVNKPDAKYDPNLVAILSGALTTIGFLALSVIGTYVGGATWDTTSYRSSISSLASTVASQPNQYPPSYTMPPVSPPNEIDPDAVSNSPLTGVVPKRKRRIRPTGIVDNSEPRG